MLLSIYYLAYDLCLVPVKEFGFNFILTNEAGISSYGQFRSFPYANAMEGTSVWNTVTLFNALDDVYIIADGGWWFEPNQKPEWFLIEEIQSYFEAVLEKDVNILTNPPEVRMP